MTKRSNTWFIGIFCPETSNFILILKYHSLIFDSLFMPRQLQKDGKHEGYFSFGISKIWVKEIEKKVLFMFILAAIRHIGTKTTQV